MGFCYWSTGGCQPSRPSAVTFRSRWLRTPAVTADTTPMQGLEPSSAIREFVCNPYEVGLDSARFARQKLPRYGGGGSGFLRDGTGFWKRSVSQFDDAERRSRPQGWMGLARNLQNVAFGSGFLLSTPAEAGLFPVLNGVPTESFAHR